jgi:hypothetical protein
MISLYSWANSGHSLQDTGARDAIAILVHAPGHRVSYGLLPSPLSGHLELILE